jgi:hypothetical protein
VYIPISSYLSAGYKTTFSFMLEAWSFMSEEESIRMLGAIFCKRRKKYFFHFATNEWRLI